MRELRVTVPEVGLIAATRGLLGAGLGLLLADRLPSDQRRAVGWALFSVGALSTIPLALDVFLRNRPSEPVMPGPARNRLARTTAQRAPRNRNTAGAGI